MPFRRIQFRGRIILSPKALVRAGKGAETEAGLILAMSCADSRVWFRSWAVEQQQSKKANRLAERLLG
jgi:hypothetical protein